MEQVPKNTRALAMVLDREHVKSVGFLMRDVRKNPTLVRLLDLWRDTGSMGYLVVAGSLRHDGAVGGMALDWDRAKALVSFVCRRLDEESANEGGFSSVWLLHLTDERREETRTLLAEIQSTEGTA